MKDNFSKQAEKYVKYRPTYPEELFSFLLSVVPHQGKAWDCGTGNGQVAHKLADYFENVFATDISPKQIENAIPGKNIKYSLQRAEHTCFPDASFDLITVAQAIHWFDFDKFYKEVNRTLKPEGIFVVIGYGLLSTFEEADTIIRHFYKNSIGSYWDVERKYVDENYLTIPFPFQEIESPILNLDLLWSFEHIVNYLATWSAVQHYIKVNGQNPIDLIYDELKSCWGNEKQRKVVFPLLLRVGRIRR